MDQSKMVAKSCESFYFAEESGPNGVNQYDHVGPGKQLEMVVRMIEGRTTPAQMERYKNRLPERMAYADFDSKGHAVLREVKTKEVDFVGPAAGATGSTVKGLGLIPILAADAVMEGAAPLVCARDVFEKQEMQSQMEQMPFFTAAVYLKPQGVGSEATDIAQDVGKNVLKAQTFRAMAKLSKELVSDAVANIKSGALKELGKAHEMTLNRYAFTKMIDFAGRDVSMGASGNATNMIDAILYARKGIMNDGFIPDKVVLWPTAEYLLLKQLNPFYNEQAYNAAEANGPFKFGRLTYYTTAVTACAAYEIGSISTAYVFDGSTTSTSKAAGSIYAMVMDSTRMGRLGILEEMEMEEFDDPIKYLEVPIINMRWDVEMAVDDQVSTRTNAYSVEDVYYHA